MRFALNYKVNVLALKAQGENFSFSATREECLDLAKNHGLLEIFSFSADYHLRALRGRAIKLDGCFKAHFTQQCVITLAPIEQHLNEKVKLIFAPKGSKLLKNTYHSKQEREIDLDPFKGDIPEIYHDNCIDIGAISEEFFELALDPYPRLAGASWECEQHKPHVKDKAMAEKAGFAESNSPFALLAKLKDKNN